MDKLPSDILFTLSTYLELPDLLKFCSINKKIYSTIYQKDNIWYYKLEKEFLIGKSLKKIHI